MVRMTRNPLEFVRKSVLFDRLDSETVRSILRQGTPCRYNTGEFLTRQGEPATHVILIQSGLASLSHTSSGGRQLLLGWLQRGEPCALASFLEEHISQLTIQAVSEVQALRWAGSVLRAIGRQHPMLLENAASRGLEVLGWTLDRLQLITSDTVERRLAILVCQSAAEVGRAVPQGIELALSDEKLAQIAGTDLFSVSRLLRHWQRSGLLDKARGRVLIHKGVGVAELVDSAERHRPVAARGTLIRETAT